MKRKTILWLLAMGLSSHLSMACSEQSSQPGNLSSTVSISAHEGRSIWNQHPGVLMPDTRGNPPNAGVDVPHQPSRASNNPQEIVLPSQSKEFLEDTSASFVGTRNQERGYFKYVGNIFDFTDDYLAGYFQSRWDKGIRLVWLAVLLDAEEPTIHRSTLDEIDRKLRLLREKGLKAIVRFAYNDGEEVPGEKYCLDATKTILVGHIEQLSSLIHNNQDVLYVIEAGFVGCWGEWHGSNNIDTEAERDPDRREILQALINFFPASVPTLLRRVMFKLDFVDGGLNHPLDESEAYTGIPKARIGHHNDCFLANPTDEGTYPNDPAKRAATKDFIGHETEYIPMGGETCRVADGEAWDRRSDCATAVVELTQLNFSYLNETYHEGVIDSWQDNPTPCYDTITQKLGYRWVLERIDYTPEVRGPQAFSMTLNLRNDGYAPIHHPKKMYLEFYSKSRDEKVDEVLLDEDVRTWKGGESAVLHHEMMLPASLTAGEYVVYLSVRDNLLQDDVRYSIRFSNLDIWQEDKGAHRIIDSLRVIR
ncbi:MAG: DUF4832 domain-containing protein [Proteobacteria bacterium]|nr:DUF4832 domain-containing protein [Pseudomonadota bacterium]